MIKFFKAVCTVFLFMFCWCAADQKAPAQKEESFIVVKKKKTKKIGRKSKEQACRSFGACAQQGAEVVQQVGRVQKIGLEKTAAYLNGDDPFAPVKKEKLQELERELKKLEQQMQVLCAQCERCMKCANKLFL